MILNATLKSLLILFPLLLATACGNMPYVNPDWTPKVGVKVLSLRWLKQLGPENKNFLIPEMVEKNDRFNPVEDGSAGFDTDKKRIFIGAAVGGLYCINAQNGKTVWRFDLDDPVGSTPRYDSVRKRVYFGADDGILYAVHARSGRLIWKFNTGAEIRRDIHVHEDTIYLTNADSTIMAIDPQEGQVIWRFRCPPMEGFSALGYADINIVGSTVFAGMADGSIVALDAITGAKLWSQDLAAEIVATTQSGDINLVDVDATPVVLDKIVVAASVAGGLYGLATDSGKVLWTQPGLTKVTGLAQANDAVYAARAGKGLCEVNPKTGEVNWCKQFGVGIMLDPVVFEDVLLISDTESGLFVISSATGEVLQRLYPKGGFFSRPSAYGGLAFIIGNHSTLYAMSIK